MNLLRRYPQLKILQSLANDYGVDIYLVGGFLRDYFLDRQRSDLDFAVSGETLKIAQEFAKRIKGSFVLLDDEHCCARVVHQADSDVMMFDFAQYRAKNFKQDLAHRDFTINTLSLDIQKLTEKTSIRQLVCDFKNARQDIQNSMIRMTNPHVFQEDPLRILRAYSLKAVLKFRIDKETERQMQVDRAALSTVSYERITTELFKILEEQKASANIRAMDRIGVLTIIMPQIKVMYNCKQGGYHHLDVWHHSLEALFQLERVFEEYADDEDVQSYLKEKIAGDRSRKALIKLGVLLHDIGKPDTKQKKDDGFSFHAHEHVGKKIVTHIANMLKLSTHERHALEDMVQYHLRPGYLSNEQQPSPRSIYRYFRDAGEEAASIVLLSMADQRATRGPLTTEQDQDHHDAICKELIKAFFAKKKEKPLKRLLSGHDVMRHFQIKPSPLLGQILSEVEEQQSLGLIKTQEDALGFVKNMIEKNKD